MSLSENIKNKVLNKSDKYTFYKNGYNEYKSKFEKLIENQIKEKNKNLIKNKHLSLKIEKLEKEIYSFKNELKDTQNNSNYLEEIDSLKNQIYNKNNEIKSLKIPFNNFEEYLIEAYNFPLVRSPFSEEAKRCFSFMEEIASYFISKVEHSNEKPLISVIMPVYNRKDVVMNAINSVLNQTYENFELIVIDDASTDGTTDLLKEINNPKVKVIFHEKNKYASGARNTGLKNAKGEYIAYLDSDNLLDERYLAATVGAFLEFPDAGGLYSAQYRYETYDSKPFAVQFGSLNKSLLHNHNFVDMNCFAHRRDVYEKIGGFDETLKGADDWDLVLKISNNYKIYSIPFLLSKCFLGVVDNRVSDLVPTDMKKIRAQNEKLPSKVDNLNKKVNIIIPIYKTTNNIDKCIENILSLKLDNKIKIIISINVPNLIDISSLSKKSNQIKIIQDMSSSGFAHSLSLGINFSDNDADILLLNEEAILTEGCLEIMQKKAYELNSCGLIVSQQVLSNGSVIQKHVPYAHNDYWCDITPSMFYKNIHKVPLFNDGEVIELKMAPFFCTYIKRDVLNKVFDLNLNLEGHYYSMRLFSEYIRNILNLKIYHLSDAIVIREATDEFKELNHKNKYDFTEDKNIALSKKYENCSWNF